jgi:adenylate cyclase
LVDELITKLSRLRSLFVIARTSSFTYRGRIMDVRQVGQELGVGYLLEGSIRRAADKLRIAVRLVDARSGGAVWADRFEGASAGLFALEDAVVGGVVATIEPRVLAAEVERAMRKRATDLAAYDCYLRALPYLAILTDEAMAHAAALLQQALNLDPGYGRASAWLALCVLLRARRGWDPDFQQGLQEAVRLARCALTADNSDALVLAVAAYVFTLVLHEHDQGAALAAQALALEENAAFVWSNCGWVSVLGGEFDEAIERFAMAIRLDPVSPAAYTSQTGTALAHFFARRFEEAERCARLPLVAEPDLHSARRILAAALILQGRTAEARAVGTEIRRRNSELALSRMRPNGEFRHSWMTKIWADAMRRLGLPA